MINDRVLNLLDQYIERYGGNSSRRVRTTLAENGFCAGIQSLFEVSELHAIKALNALEQSHQFIPLATAAFLFFNPVVTSLLMSPQTEGIGSAVAHASFLAAGWGGEEHISHARTIESQIGAVRDMAEKNHASVDLTTAMGDEHFMDHTPGEIVNIYRDDK